MNTGPPRADIVYRRCLAALLARTDYVVTEAENGEEALAAVAKQRPDLILMDIEPPIMDGYEATRRRKADPSLSSIPIIAVTSFALSGYEEKARAVGCDDFVPNLTARVSFWRRFGNICLETSKIGVSFLRLLV